MSSHTFIAICSVLSAVVGLGAGIPYAISIVKGKSRPHQFSWLIFTIMGGVTFFSQVLAGARGSSLLFLAFFINQLVFFLMSLKYGVRSTSRFDKVLLTLALLTIVAWIVSRSNALAIWLTVIVDVPATAMTVLKLRKHPNSEDLLAWWLGTVACVFSCLTLAHTHLGILYVRPYYALLSELAVILGISYSRVVRTLQS